MNAFLSFKLSLFFSASQSLGKLKASTKAGNVWEKLQDDVIELESGVNCEVSSWRNVCEKENFLRLSKDFLGSSCGWSYRTGHVLR